MGRFVGKEALSAVAGSTGMLTQMVVGFFVGLSSGAAVLVSQYYGARKEEMVEYAVHTFFAFFKISIPFLFIPCFGNCPYILDVGGYEDSCRCDGNV